MRRTPVETLLEIRNNLIESVFFSPRYISKILRVQYSGSHTANVSWQTQVGVCERHKNSRQTRWQTVGDK